MSPDQEEIQRLKKVIEILNERTRQTRAERNHYFRVVRDLSDILANTPGDLPRDQVVKLLRTALEDKGEK